MPKALFLALMLAAQAGSATKEELPEGDKEEATEEGKAPKEEQEVVKPSSALTPPPGDTPVENKADKAEREKVKEEVQPQAEDFFQFSDFVDTRVTFALSNVNLLAGPGERLYPTSGYRIGVDRNFNLFLENVNTRFSGFESLSHAVLYKKLPGFWKYWETEAALAILVLADTDTGKFSFFDSGTYLRVIRKLDEGKEEKVGSIDFTAWPVSADRFRLGYTYIISWGGTAIFPGKLQTSSITEGAVPGFRLRYRSPEGKTYAFAGFKSALLLSRQRNVTAGEQVPNYGVLAGGGTDLGGFIVEANGGFFQKGNQERPGVEGLPIRAYGASARATVYQGYTTRQSTDFALYRNDPTDPIDYLLYREYRPGTGFSVAVEGSVLGQNLEDPDRPASEKIVPAISAGLVAIAKLDQITLRLDGFYKSADFILFNVPGIVPFQATSAAATTTPEFFLSGTFEYVLEDIKLRPSISLGVKVPATYKGVVLADQGNMIGGAVAGEVRTQVIVDETTRTVLPPGETARPIFGIVAKAPLALSRSTAVALEARYELNNNQPRLAQDPMFGDVTYFFDSPHRLSLALVLQSRW